jgi:hypothetical protein
MFTVKTKKYVFAGPGLMLLSFLLLVLAGCDATSDPRQYYQPTGSWQGTINDDQVRGIIAPDGSYHLAIVDTQGNSVGEYVGRIGFVDPENVGSMTLQRLQPPENAGTPQGVTFKLDADRLYSLQGIELSRTPDAAGPAAQIDVAGRWSLSSGDNVTAVIVDAEGTFSGGDGHCQYSGTLQLQDPSWNIYSFNLTTSNYPGLSCPQGAVSYRGLAMLLGREEVRPRLWFAANSAAKIFVGEWAKTDNVPPVAQMTILGEREDQSVLVQEGATVELDAQGSSDANNDLLTYEWSGTDPNTTSLNIAGGSAATFVPLVPGEHKINLTVSDGITPNTLTRSITVVRTTDRFIGCNNGTVLDTRTNLLWLQDAGCVALNQLDANWGVSHALALERVGTLLFSGVCSLGDNSAAGDWRLPTLKDFSYIVPRSQWSAANLFVNVGTNLPYYWTADADPAIASNWFHVHVGYVAPAEWYGSSFENNARAVWPVRAVRSRETCPKVP